jgi:hypothetical protein
LCGELSPAALFEGAVGVRTKVMQSGGGVL